MQARQAGLSVALADAGTGTDTSTMPLVQVGDPPYAGTGPLKFANADVANIHVVCPTLDVTVENKAGATVPAGAVCQITPTLVNTGEAKWLATSAASRGVTLHTSAGDIPLGAALPSMQRTAMGPLTITMPASGMIVTGRMQIAGVGAFGEVFTLQLVTDVTLTRSSATTLSSTGPIVAPAAGVTGTIQVSVAAGCNWTTYIYPQQWATLTPASGSGNGTATYTIAPNLGSARQTRLDFAGHTFTVTQAANAIVPLTAAPALSTTALAFANQNLATSSAPQSVRLTNNGTAALQLSSLTVGGPNNGDFVEADNCGPSVASRFGVYDSSDVQSHGARGAPRDPVRQRRSRRRRPRHKSGGHRCRYRSHSHHSNHRGLLGLHVRHRAGSVGQRLRYESRRAGADVECRWPAIAPPRWAA